MKRNYCLLVLVLLATASTYSQVPVSKEPRHKKVLQNKYLRLLDVWIGPGDTSLYHIHSTPSVFLYFTNTLIGSQVRGQAWTSEKTVAGKTWYRSFSPEILVHRVCNLDTIPLHVTDVEILRGDRPKATYIPLRLPLVFENEKVAAYRVTDTSPLGKGLHNRGPIIVEVVKGEKVFFSKNFSKKKRQIREGGYLYLKPRKIFTLHGQGELELILFEIK